MKDQIEQIQTETPVLTYEAWKAELVKVSARETGRPESDFDINDKEARQWWLDGFTPWGTFRETYREQCI